MNNLITLENGQAVVAQADPWFMAGGDAAAEITEGAILPLAQWLDYAASSHKGAAFQRKIGVCLHPDDDPDALAPWIDQLPLIALQFPRFSDGRAYSQAYLLRSRLGFTGDLRAVGDVLRDQLAAMRHCGFSSFVVREDRSVEDALKGLTGFDLIYARSVKNPEPLFRRRGESDWLEDSVRSPAPSAIKKPSS